VLDTQGADGSSIARRLLGKAALVTGGGSGIGRAVARRFSAEGARVAVADLDGDRAAEVADELEGEALALEVNVSDTEAVERMVARTIDAFGRLDVLVSNAGVPQTAKPFVETSLAEWDRVIAVNLTALFLVARASVPAMRRQGGGAIVVTASIAASRPRPGIAAYVASKAGAIGLTRALALELAPEGIRVNAVSPVAVRTPMLKDFGFGEDEQATIERVEQTIPLGRIIEPEDVAAAALYLASDDARCVTGITLNVDGGRDL
jgi:3-oxoacyl-[acyl-carrier protein] reductase